MKISKWFEINLKKIKVILLEYLQRTLVQLINIPQIPTKKCFQESLPWVPWQPLLPGGCYIAIISLQCQLVEVVGASYPPGFRRVLFVFWKDKLHLVGWSKKKFFYLILVLYFKKIFSLDSNSCFCSHCTSSLAFCFVHWWIAPKWRFDEAILFYSCFWQVQCRLILFLP